MDTIDILLTIINFAGALAVFLFAMKLMSEGLQKFAGSRMRHILGKITGNPLSGILAGAAVTAAIQSSTATTVMVVSFAGAGLLTLSGAVAVVMGANIGTTITAWIITLFGLGETNGQFSLPLLLAAASLFFIFNKKNNLQSLGQTIIGLALLLIGMELLQNVMPDLQQHPQTLQTIASWSQWGFWSILLFIIVGAILTIIIQTSAAMTAIILLMSYNGWIDFNIAVALVMGQNLGTTLTAQIVAITTGTTGKRAARAHLVFNIAGVILCLILFHPITHLITQEEDEFRLTYIEPTLLSTAELNLQSAKNEILEFSKRILRMYTFLPNLRTAPNEEEFNKTIQRISKYETITDNMELEITKFLTRVGSGDVSQHASERISTMLRIIDNLESIGDTIYQIAITRKNKRQDAVHFDPGLNANLDHMTNLVQQALDIMDQNLHDYDHINLDAAYNIEHQINTYRDRLRTQHLDALKLGVYNYAIGNAYSSLYALYEKLGDYIINVSEAIDNSRKHTED